MASTSPSLLTSSGFIHIMSATERMCFPKSCTCLNCPVAVYADGKWGLSCNRCECRLKRYNGDFLYELSFQQYWSSRKPSYIPVPNNALYIWQVTTHKKKACICKYIGLSSGVTWDYRECYHKPRLGTSYWVLKSPGSWPSTQIIVWQSDFSGSSLNRPSQLCWWPSPPWNWLYTN